MWRAMKTTEEYLEKRRYKNPPGAYAAGPSSELLASQMGISSSLLPPTELLVIMAPFSRRLIATLVVSCWHARRGRRLW